METPAPPVPFHIDTTTYPATVQIDGHNIADKVRGCTVYIGWQEPTRLVLDVQTPGVIDGLGIIETTTSQPGALELLEGIDADQLEVTVMESEGEYPSMAAAYLTAIIRIIEQAQQ